MAQWFGRSRCKSETVFHMNVRRDVLGHVTNFSSKAHLTCLQIEIITTRETAGGALVSLSAVQNSETGLCAGSSNEAFSLKRAAP